MLSQPLELVTGLPGASKTLHTIYHVEEVRKRTGREVYYSGIADLKLPWTEIDPEKWMQTPPGSIIVIDEAQRIFRPSSVNKEPQPWITELETIRHGGRNMVMVTQQPMLLHSNVRRLAGKHYHLVRVWGSHRATMHEFDGVKENCSSRQARIESIKHHLKFPRQVFTYYKSAEIHTVKRAIPMRVKLLALLVLALPVLWWFLWQRMHEPPGVKPKAVEGGGLRVMSAEAARPGERPQMTPASYMEAHTPRLPGFAHTAPVYDKIMEPSIAPKPVACVASSTRCSCYTQQGTKLSGMPQLTCRSLVENGYFDDAPDRDQKNGRADPREGFFDRQERSARVVVAANEPSRLGEAAGARDAPHDEGMAIAARGRGYGLADPSTRQTVTQPATPSKNDVGGSARLAR